MTFSLRNTLILVVVSILFLLLGYFIGANFKKKTIEKDNSIKEKESFSEIRLPRQNSLINPLLDCDNFAKSNAGYIVDLENEVKKYIAQSLHNGSSKHISFYFRSLNNGPWSGVEEHHVYAPASLLKVPIMIATLKYAENHPGFLHQKYLYDKVVNTEYTPNIKDEIIQLGKTYTTEELIRYTIIFSDNEAKEILIALVGEDFILKTMAEMGVNLYESNMDGDFISVKQYSSFFRILYNATYLSPEYSNLALTILKDSKFVKGISRNIPQSIVIAHKFGERGFEGSDDKQLHDCGIVYYRQNPYLICVMTKGKDFDQLADVISDISTIVFKHVAGKEATY